VCDLVWPSFARRALTSTSKSQDATPKSRLA